MLNLYFSCTRQGIVCGKRETVRSQLKAVQSKTGARRQIELVSLLAGKTFPRGQ